MGGCTLSSMFVHFFLLCAGNITLALQKDAFQDLLVKRVIKGVICDVQEREQRKRFREVLGRCWSRTLLVK